MKTFSSRPGPSALLEYCKIRSGFEASFTIKPYSREKVCMRIFNDYGALLCNYRKKNRKRTGSSKNIRHFFATTLQAATSARRTYLSCTRTSMGLCVVYMAMARGADFIRKFQGGLHVHFLKASADFQKTYGGHPGTKWQVVYMGNCPHFHPRTSFNSVIWTELKVVPG